jgi:hypothetical protein
MAKVWFLVLFFDWDKIAGEFRKKSHSHYTM